MLIDNASLLNNKKDANPLMSFYQRQDDGINFLMGQSASAEIRKAPSNSLNTLREAGGIFN